MTRFKFQGNLNPNPILAKADPEITLYLALNLTLAQLEISK